MIGVRSTCLGLALLTTACGTAHVAPRAPSPAVAASRSPAPSAPAATAAVATTTISAAFIGEGSLEAKGEGVAKTRLALERLAISATTSGDVAETTVEHVFRNDSDQVLEGTLRFPLPDGAILTGLALEIDGKLIDGELVEREKARKAYEQIVDQMMDPALLEWEGGQTFKLRVFPIEAHAAKRVVVRFVAPLHRTEDGVFFAFRPPSSEASLTTEKVALTVDGRSIATTGARTGSGEVLVPVGSVGARPADVVAETRSDAAYWVAHVTPRLSAAAPATHGGQAMIVLCDRSRSMLEARGLQKRTVGLLLDKLDAADRFTVVTGDVQTRSLGALRSPGTADKAAAVDFVDAIEPDGASDVALLVGAARAAIADARRAGLDPVVVYLGDGSATWGRAAELERIAKESTDGAALHVVILGKSTDEPAARALAAGAHGKVMRPKTESDAARAATEIVAARTKRRVEDVHVVGAEGFEMPSSLPSTIYEGDALTIALKGNAAGMPSSLRLLGTENGKPFAQAIDLANAKPARHVARRWAKAKIDLLERDGDAHKEEIVKASLEHGVMSRYTSFLVLDSEEAYARFQIARKAKARAAEDAQVSGQDLDGEGRVASVSPDHLQPGDPEVRIPAPADAQSVVVVFPFGETKTASFEPDRSGSAGYWVARFLVDRSTPDGTYEIVVRITHRDGRVEIVKLPYVVDTQRPNLDVRLTRRANGSFEIRAKQRLSDEEVDAQSAAAQGTVDERRQRLAHVLTDAKRVEVRTPDGQVLPLVHVLLGEFVGTWTPRATFEPSAKLRVVAVDRALNERLIEIEVPR